MKKIALTFCLIAATQAHAGEQTGLITEIRVSSLTTGNPTHFQLEGAWINKPSCASTEWWAIDSDSPDGQNLLSSLLTAYTTTKPIKVWGSGTCGLRDDMETAIQVGL